MCVENYEILLTILTPTYNRGHLLQRLYESLVAQTNKQFKWMVVDDGSEDGTGLLLQKYKSQGHINMEYIQKKNGGKHTALNYAIPLIDTKYTFILDSDDYILPNAVENIVAWINDIGQIDKSIVGVSGLRGNYRNGILVCIGGKPKRTVVANNFERRRKKLTGDKAEVYQTDILKKYPFSEYENEKFSPEDIVWNKIALAGGRIKWHPVITVVCEYLEGGLTDQTKTLAFFENNYNGYCESHKINFQGQTFPYKYFYAASFYRKAKAIGKNSEDIISGLGINTIQFHIVRIANFIYKLLKGELTK
ncbi:glycosyltransferase family 2 protein [Lachnospiraceae bacterium JLR.KK009]